MPHRMLALLAALALLAVSCGDDDEAQPTTQVPAPSTSVPEAPDPTLPGALEGRIVVGADGIESMVADTSRIISLNGDITEIIYELGLGDRLVAVDVTTTFPPESDGLPRIGFAQQLAAEPVLGFAPTVVIGDQQIQPADSIEQIRAAGIPVVIIETQTTLAGIETKILAVADALGADDAGRELADRVNAEIAEATALAAQAQEQARVAFVYSRGPQQIFLFGSGTVTQALIEGANAVDTISDSGLPAVVPLTPEALVAAAPDVIIVPASGVGALGGMEAIAGLPGVGETPAGRDGAFLVYDDGLFLNFGPRTGQALRQLVTDLYPELEG